MTVGERIRQRRLELGMTQDELAQKAGYKSRSSINKLELARVLPSRKILKIAEALECDPGVLMGWEKESEEEKALDISSDELRMILEFRDVSDEIKQMIQTILDNAEKKGNARLLSSEDIKRIKDEESA